MNILNRFFDKIYVISSFSTQNRITNLIQFLNTNDVKYEFVIAPKKKYFDDYNQENLWLGKGAFSLLSVNESIFLKEFYIKSKSFCILEDDIWFDSNYKEKLNVFFERLPNSWDVLNLGYHKNTPLNQKFDASPLPYYKLNADEEIVGTHFVAYKNNVVQYILDKIEHNGYPMDWFLSKAIYPNFNTYTCTDKIFYASSYREYESDKSEFYKKYKSQIG
jgi:hypothetical protein